MDRREWATWVERNPRNPGGVRYADRPCVDCPLAYAAEMRAIGRCNGAPGGERPPVNPRTLAPAAPAAPPLAIASDVTATSLPDVRRTRSPEARANMAAAQRASWDRRRAAKAAANPAHIVSTRNEIGNISPPDLAPEPGADTGIENAYSAPVLPTEPGLVADHSSASEAPIPVASVNQALPPDPPQSSPYVVLPCEDCIHAIVCSIKPRLASFVGYLVHPDELDPAVRVSAVALSCDHYRGAEA